MKLSDIISISGKPGLYKLINRTRAPFTAESLDSGRKQPLFARDNIVSLADISIYTEEGEKPLGEVFEAIKGFFPEGISNEEVNITDKGSLRDFMKQVLPIYDKERVHDSDIKKLVKWYNTLRNAGMDTFIQDDNRDQQQASED